MKLVFVPIILLLGLTACSFDIPEPDAYLRKQRIFSAEDATKQRLEQYVSMPFDSYWTPTQLELDRIFAKTVIYIETTEKDNIKPLASYRHQHFGYISDGKQYIYNNYFCESYDIDTEWYSSFISVDDGGNCFFQSIYDVTEQEIISLYINGEA